jgi:hypothetical protein
LLGLGYDRCPASDAYLDEYYQSREDDWRLPHRYDTGCPRNNSIISVRNDLIIIPRWNGTEHSNHSLYSEHNVRVHPFLHVLRKYGKKIKLLIMNRGAHYVPDDEFISEVNNTLAYLRDMHPHVNIVWRSSYFGDLSARKHAFASPLTKIPPASGKWNYNQMEHQNNLVQRLVYQFTDVLEPIRS